MPSGRIAVFFGTRPEVIKLAPVILEFTERGWTPLVVSTGQHRELLDQALQLFGILPDIDLRLMREEQSLDHVLSSAISRVGRVLDEHRPTAVVVQGDTTSTAGAALAAFHRRIPVAHIEAGLRSHDLRSPFPEELNRRVVSLIADWHFAPTQRSAQNLQAEGASGHVVVTGNTVVDALHWILQRPATIPSNAERLIDGKPYILATAHRRESWAGGIQSVAKGLVEVLQRLPDHRLIFSLHPNPVVRHPVEEILGGMSRSLIVDALPYPTFVRLMSGAALVVSDSGGVQEEAPTLGVPVLVTRSVTERPEGVDAGAVVIVGTEQTEIVKQALAILRDKERSARMRSAGRALYGDGHAAARIVDALATPTPSQ